MASSSKLAANRANARKSTGPKSENGKRRASKNARRHGLSIPIVADRNCSAQILSVAQAIAGEAAVPVSLEIAKQVAATQLDVLRVRQARQQLLARTFADEFFEPKEQTWLREQVMRNAAEVAPASVQRLLAALSNRPAGTMKQALVYSELTDQLLKLDRYERRALSRRQRAIRAFDVTQCALAAGRRPRRYVIDVHNGGGDE